MVALGDLSALAMLCRQFEGWLEEVHEESRGAIQARNRFGSGNALEALIAQKFAHDGAVFLLDPSLVVLAIRTRAGEFDPMAQTVFDQPVVHKFGTVVDIQRAKGEGQADTDALERFNNEAAFTHCKRRRFRPATGNVRQNQPEYGGYDQN